MPEGSFGPFWFFFFFRASGFQYTGLSSRTRQELGVPTEGCSKRGCSRRVLGGTCGTLSSGNASFRALSCLAWCDGQGMRNGMNPGFGALKGNHQLDGFSWGHSISHSLAGKFSVAVAFSVKSRQEHSPDAPQQTFSANTSLRRNATRASRHTSANHFPGGRFRSDTADFQPPGLCSPDLWSSPQGSSYTFWVSISS